MWLQGEEAARFLYSPDSPGQTSPDLISRLFQLKCCPGAPSPGPDQRLVLVWMLHKRPSVIN